MIKSLKYEPQKYFKTRGRLQVAIDSGLIDDLLTQQFLSRYDLPKDLDHDGFIHDLPYWCFEGSIEYATNGLVSYDPETIIGQYRKTMHEPLEYGDTLDINGKTYEYFAELQLPAEIAHQADDGLCCYEYLGTHYIRVFKPIK